MVYLAIKSLAGIANGVIIVTSSLTKDMTGKEDAFRAPAIRALCAITDDGTILQAIERYMKQALMDKSPTILSSALVSAQHLGLRTSGCGEVIRRWGHEAQKALSSDALMVQYHALGLLYHIRKSDRQAVIKLVAKLTKSSLRSPYAVCLLIRISRKLIEEAGEFDFSDYINNCLRHKSKMVSTFFSLGYSMFSVIGT
jgi:coatomer protein complex subunit gamma